MTINFTYKKFLLSIGTLFFIHSVNATNYTTNVKADCITKMTNALPGDTVTVLNGTYNWDLLSFVNTHGVYPGAPIVFQAQTPGLVIFNGTTKFSFQITNMVFTGFVFKNGSAGVSSVIKVGKGSTQGSFYCRITNNVIDNYNSDTALLQKNAWIELDGDHHRVDHNTFINKSNQTATIIVIYTPVVYPAKAVSTFNRIDSNYFKQRSYMGENEGETIRVGDAASARTDGYNVVEFNLVEDVITAGELEIFSNKSHSNTYRYNTLRNSNGGICLRAGRYCNVYGNFIINNNPAREVAGIRIIDKGHKIFNNYIEGVNGAGLSSDQKRASICLYDGNFSDSTLGSAEYFPADSCTVAFNTIVNGVSGAGVVLGCVHGGSIQPKGIVLGNNLVKMTSGTALYMNASNTLLTQTSEGNIWDAPSGQGLAIAGWQNSGLTFGARDHGVLPSPALVTDVAVNSANYTTLLNAIDGQGQLRSAVYDVGFDELNGTGPIIYEPLDATKVGALFYLGALPVHLLSFNALVVNGSVVLNWKVENEMDFKHYEVEISYDGIHFERLSVTPAIKASNYSYQHTDPRKGIIYYRLKMVNLDEKFEYSPVRKISIGQVKINIYPNPTRSFVTIDLNGAFRSNTTIELYESGGKLLKRITATQNLMNIPLNDLAPGLYLLQIKNEESSVVNYPFIIQR